MSWMHVLRSAASTALALLLLCASGAACAQPSSGRHIDVAFHGTLFNSAPQTPLASINMGWSVSGGILLGNWGAFLQLEQSLWHGTEYGASVVPGTLNLGLGTELRFANGLIRSSLALGPAMLLFATRIDKAGQLGMFLEARPLGLRWRLGPRFALGLDPLSLAIVAPVLTGIPLFRVQYRTTLSMEFDLS